MELGSVTHKELFCRSIIDTHKQYDPLEMPWPELDEPALELVRSIPFWEEALYREIQAGRLVSAYAETVDDPLVREAIAMQGVEETRHARLIEGLMRTYDIKVRLRPVEPLPADLEDAFMALGYEECLDSFFAFGMYRLAADAHIFPEKIFAIFNQLIDEETRHNLYFINWAAYHQIRTGQGAEIIRSLRSLWYYGQALTRLVSGFASGTANSPGFTAHGISSFAIDLTPEKFIRTCLQEQELRMTAFDRRLLRPQLMPTLAGLASQLLSLWPSPQPHSRSA
ncbi:hypothetical protein [Gloeobacter kilaueensis]|uniref:Ferritin-like domain-containing protein n=1 Tax=Gloeobacter kilaueensis (strain ATCC BAA-2537 / CCAP 1431/1 / ULC 316 / JS1) TaxID=1183438 RepID=U5QCH8_GLOK1|nr:hypothetical protein [Gloeobacter kilaueensis]AGY56543.1 hypothetical protein GKIL_0296 [Gloeobacter kilaueensis JS1]